MRKAQLVVSALILALVLLVACTPVAAPAPAPQAPAAAPAAAPATAPAPALQAPAKSAWETEWEKTLAAAKQEGVVVFTISSGSATRRELSVAFQDKYGIKVESAGATAGTLISKMLAERRAGLYLWDVYVGGVAAGLSMLKPGGASSPLDTALILPDLADPEVIKKVWFNGKLPWIDREHHLIGALLYLVHDVGINTNLIKPGEIKVWDDLLDPKWKGKILLMDPTQPGTNSDGGLMLLLYDVKGEDWVRRLVTQEPVIVADDRLATEWLARGKYPIYMPPRGEAFLEFLKAGAPIMYISLDVTRMTAGPTAVALIDKAPHPNTAKLFINWYLSKEGVTIVSKERQGQSARLDVPTDFLPADEVRKPDGKYWLKDREEILFKVDDYRKKSKEIFGRLIK